MPNDTDAPQPPATTITAISTRSPVLSSCLNAVPTHEARPSSGASRRAAPSRAARKATPPANVRPIATSRGTGDRGTSMFAISFPPDSGCSRSSIRVLVARGSAGAMAGLRRRGSSGGIRSPTIRPSRSGGARPLSPNCLRQTLIARVILPLRGFDRIARLLAGRSVFLRNSPVPNASCKRSSSSINAAPCGPTSWPREPRCR